MVLLGFRNNRKIRICLTRFVYAEYLAKVPVAGGKAVFPGPGSTPFTWEF